MYEYAVEIDRIIDGDTVDVVYIDLGFNVKLHNQRIRLQGIDTPEVRTRDLAEKEAGLEAKAFVEGLLPVGSKQILTVHKYEGGRGKYGRILGDFRVYDAENDRETSLVGLLLRS